MTRKTLFQRLADWLGLLGFMAVLSFPAYGSIIDGVLPDIFVSATSYDLPANGRVDGYGPSNRDLRESPGYNGNFLVVSANGTEVLSTPQQFANVGYTTIGTTRYFAFVLDSQETKHNELLSIDRVRILVGGTEVWSTTEAIVLNSGAANFTLTPLGNGGDMALYVPIRVFDALSLTGSSTFVFAATHSSGENGGDEWKFTDFGVMRDPVTGTVRRFALNEPVRSELYAIPEPSTALLLLTGIGLLGFVSRRRVFIR